MQPVPKRIAIERTQAAGKIQRQWPVAGTDEIFPQLNFIWSENTDAPPATRNGDIPLLRVRCGLDGGIGKENIIHRLALRAVGRDGVARKKFTETLVQNPAIGQFDFPIGKSRFDRDQFTIRNARAGGQLAVGLQMQFVTLRDRNLTRKADIDFIQHLV